jgi:hypothetical protein
MKSFVASLIVIVVVGFGTAIVLDSSFQKSASQAFATTGARL